jgi:hypothetical protein
VAENEHVTRLAIRNGTTSLMVRAFVLDSPPQTGFPTPNAGDKKF